MRIADELNTLYEAQVDMRDKTERDDLEVKFSSMGKLSDEMLNSLQASSGGGIERMKQYVSELGSSAKAIVPSIQKRKTLRGFNKNEFKVIKKAFTDIVSAGTNLSRIRKDADKITVGQVQKYLSGVLGYIKEIKPIMDRFEKLANL